jgi:hypothetical protein
MTKDHNPLHIGVVQNFTNTNIDGDGIPYFEFALNPISDPANQQVFYVNLRKGYATDVCTAAIFSWANQSVVEVILEEKPGGMRVKEIRPA